MRTCRIKIYVKQAVLFMLTAILCLGAVVSTQAAEISNPRIKKAAGMKSGQKVTYDCVYFGSYPQAEVVKSKAAETAIDKSIRSGKDYIVDADLYAKLKKAKKWDKNGDIVINGEKYRRIKFEDSTLPYRTDQYVGYYQWDKQYHYFKYQPIKWRVLSKDSEEMFLMADTILDCQWYRNYQGSSLSILWENATLRTWLNGNGFWQNGYGFTGTAFSKKQDDTIICEDVKTYDNQEFGTYGGIGTFDRVFLLAEKEVYWKSAKKYGFSNKIKVQDEARRAVSSSYAKAMGCVTDDNGCGRWWLRSPGEDRFSVVIIDTYGEALYRGLQADLARSIINPFSPGYGVRPALKINLKKPAEYKYAGTVCTDGTVTKAE